MKPASYRVAIEAFQRLWNDLGYCPILAEDGLPGPRTDKAARYIIDPKEKFFAHWRNFLKAQELEIQQHITYTLSDIWDEADEYEQNHETVKLSWMKNLLQKEQIIHGRIRQLEQIMERI